MGMLTGHSGNCQPQYPLPFGLAFQPDLASSESRWFRRIFKRLLYSWILARRVSGFRLPDTALLPRCIGQLRLRRSPVGDMLSPLASVGRDLSVLGY
jgi:hypothetical protein